MDEAVLITQVVEVNGNNFAFLQPYGSKFDDIETALHKLIEDNRAKRIQLKEQAEKAQLQQEAINAHAEAQGE